MSLLSLPVSVQLELLKGHVVAPLVVAPHMVRGLTMLAEAKMLAEATMLAKAPMVPNRIMLLRSVVIATYMTAGSWKS